MMAAFPNNIYYLSQYILVHHTTRLNYTYYCYYAPCDPYLDYYCCSELSLLVREKSCYGKLVSTSDTMLSSITARVCISLLFCIFIDSLKTSESAVKL